MRDFKAEVENNFSYHKVGPEVAARMEELRAKFKALALEILDNCPETRDRQVGITHLEQALMWSIASLARQEPVAGTAAAVQLETELARAKELLLEVTDEFQDLDEVPKITHDILDFLKIKF